MKMSIKWHAEAVNELLAILKYCEGEFGIRTAKQVRKRIFEHISRLGTFPNLGMREPSLENSTLLYRFVSIPPIKVIYTVHKDYVFIHALWNTSRNPTDLASMLKERND
ncbi:MAG: type II toxin-antitoxin system RelE/ParE family toxin [Parabacteroides sp.]|nr:type II toxin-antitoxin system RelE/ParE family toxin [Parabacteroides sp.]